jgi:hypothetical protein
MPHMNVLDLPVFPLMSRRHIAKGQGRGSLGVLSEDQIWETAMGVWVGWSFRMQRLLQDSSKRTK